LSRHSQGCPVRPAAASVVVVAVVGQLLRLWAGGLVASGGEGFLGLECAAAAGLAREREKTSLDSAEQMTEARRS
jgi:hypothetical protein